MHSDMHSDMNLMILTTATLMGYTFNGSFTTLKVSKAAHQVKVTAGVMRGAVLSVQDLVDKIEVVYLMQPSPIFTSQRLEM